MTGIGGGYNDWDRRRGVFLFCGLDLWLQNDCAVEVDYAGGNGGGT